MVVVLYFLAASQITSSEDEYDDNETPAYGGIDNENETFEFAESIGEMTPLEEAGCSSSNVSKSATKRGRRKVMTARLAAALDNAKISDGMAVHVIVATAEALGHRVEDLVINRSSIQRARQENRFKESHEISTRFVLNVISLFIKFPIRSML